MCFDVAGAAEGLAQSVAAAARGAGIVSNRRPSFPLVLAGKSSHGVFCCLSDDDNVTVPPRSQIKHLIKHIDNISTRGTFTRKYGDISELQIAK